MSNILPSNFGDEMKNLSSDIKVAVIGAILMFVVSVSIFTPANAADLPTRLELPGEELPKSNARQPFRYLGLYGGTEAGYSSLGVVAGVEPLKYFRAEVEYTHVFREDLDLLTVNGVLQAKGDIFTPYVLGGVGYFWAGDQNDLALTAGAGLRAKIHSAAELDLRYRHLFDENANLFTAGFSVKF